jgi:hypothetical protein
MPARKVVPIIPEPAKIRRIQGSFAWLDHRLARDGVLDTLSLAEIALYVFLVLAADKNGISHWRKDLVSKRLGIDWSQYEEAKAGLLEKGLIAFRPFVKDDVDGFVQILPVPAGCAR